MQGGKNIIGRLCRATGGLSFSRSASRNPTPGIAVVLLPKWTRSPSQIQPLIGRGFHHSTNTFSRFDDDSDTATYSPRRREESDSFLLEETHGRTREDNYRRPDRFDSRQRQYSDRFHNARKPRKFNSYYNQSYGHSERDYFEDYDYNGPNEFRSRHNKELGAGIKEREWKTENLTSIEKNFYVLHPSVSERTQAEIDEFYAEHKISMDSGEAPIPLAHFHEAQFPERVNSQLEKNGWSSPTPIQSMGWPLALSGKNTVGIAQTGSGKTLGFILPALVHIKHQRPVDRGEGPLALVLAPTRELAQQIRSVALEYGRPLGIRSCCIFGGQSKIHQARQISQGPELVVATPGRLLDFIEAGVINLDRTTYVVMDEADRMLDMGFEPQIRKVLGQIRPDRQILMWSATWPEEIQQLAHDFLGDFTQVNIGSTELTANPNIQQIVRVCEQNEKFEMLLEELRTNSQNGIDKILIFAQTKRIADFLARKLTNQRFRAMAIHGDKSQSMRDETLNRFRKGVTPILVATDVAARGLDVDDIKMVINYDYPNTVDDYIHRIGRTARASKTGVAVTFITDEDARKVDELISLLEVSEQEVNPELRFLSRLNARLNKKGSSHSRRNSYERKPFRPNYYGRPDRRNSW